ncbi:hypothetical protein ANN_24258 [Periplaneta americana]|uniref:Uncharacterized protein n=1 Tax=Periplaneta americana TaxID=6978 RepID=A0ABQ8S314_PERAM|nr:hypothetical protein ANN_24258 [Periplaneta americana]
MYETSWYTSSPLAGPIRISKQFTFLPLPALPYVSGCDDRDWINLAQDRDLCEGGNEPPGSLKANVIEQNLKALTRVDGNSEGGSLLAFASRETDRESKAAYNIATSYFTSTCNTNSAGENLNYQKTVMTLAVDYCKHDTKQTLFPSLTIFFARFSIPHHMLLQSFLVCWQRCSQHQDDRQRCARQRF